MTTIIDYLKRGLSVLDSLLGHIEAWTLAGSVMLMAALNIANVIGRNFGQSIIAAAELNRLLIILITFVGIGYGVRQIRHIRMSAFSEQLSGMPAKVLEVITQLVTAGLLLLLAWYGLEYVQRTYAVGSVTPALQIPLYWIYLAVPFGLALGAVQYLLAVARNLLSPGIHMAFREPDNEHAHEQDSPL